MFAYRSHNPAPQQNPSVSWQALIEGYLAELAAAGRPPSTRRLRADQLTHLARGLGLAPQQVSRNTLLGWFAAQRWATETRRGYRGAARGFFGWAHRTGALASDPAAELPAIRARQGVPRPVPDTAYQAALEHASPRVALMLRLAAEAGLRRAEIAAIHTSDLTHDGDGYWLLVHGKGDKQRLIPLPTGLGAAIRARSGWVFPSERGGHVSPRWVGQMCAEALPGGWTLHGLRHRFATRAYARSRDLRAVQELLGHASPAITQRYVAVSEMNLRAAMNAAAD